MNKRLAAIVTLIAIGVMNPVYAGGNAETGKAKAVPCAACHGADGNSVNGAWPKLAGQHAQFIESQLKAFRSGERSNPLMTGQAAALSDQDILDLAAYYSEQTLKPGVADPDKVDLGQTIYRAGNADTEVSACMACHGPSGKGNGPAGYPRIGGQHGAYVAAQLKAYASGERGNTTTGRMMQDIASKMSDKEIEAVASFVEGLY